MIFFVVALQKSREIAVAQLNKKKKSSKQSVILVVVVI